MSENKYKEFRNYMTNELGITRQDIEAWTKEAVAGQVSKLVGQINIQELSDKATREVVKANIMGGSFGSGREMRQALAVELAKEIKIELIK